MNPEKFNNQKSFSLISQEDQRINLFPQDPENKLEINISPQEYNQALDSLVDQYKAFGTCFSERMYQGHMNYDVSKPHVDAVKTFIEWNQNQVAGESGKVSQEHELKFIERMKHLVGYAHSSSWGYISTGGTVSNIMGLWIARNKARSERRFTRNVYASKRCHYSIRKACNLLDLDYHECGLNADTGSMMLPEDIDPKETLAIVVTMGATETGTVDDLQSILCSFSETSVHIHADAAWGGYFLYGNETSMRTRTFEQLNHIRYADSITIDPHKLGYAPYGMGIFLLRNGSDCKFTDFSADYINDNNHNHNNNNDNNNNNNNQLSGFSCTLEGSRSGTLATAAYFGHSMLEPTYPVIVNKLLEGSRHLQKMLSDQSEIEVFPVTDLAITLFRFVSPRQSMAYLKSRFGDSENLNHFRIRLVTTKIEGELYFRITTMDPNFCEYCDRFVQCLMDNYRTYCQEMNQQDFMFYD